MRITLTVLGGRLQELRKDLKLSQSDIANQLGYPQNAVSKLENGKGGSIDFLLNLIHFYQQHFVIDALFSESFYVLRQNEDNNATIHRIIIERLKVLEEDVRIETEQLIKLLN